MILYNSCIFTMIYRLTSCSSEMLRLDNRSTADNRPLSRKAVLLIYCILQKPYRPYYRLYMKMLLLKVQNA